MKRLCRKLAVLMAVFPLPALLSVDVAKLQDAGDPEYLSVDVMPMLELPAYITNPILLRSGNGFRLKSQISNNSDDLILGITYQLLVLDSANRKRMMASQSAAPKLAGYETRDLNLRLPGKIKIKSGDRLVLAIEQVITRYEIWAVLNSREALEAYRRGDYLAPEVKRVLNQVDSADGLRVIH